MSGVLSMKFFISVLGLLLCVTSLFADDVVSDSPYHSLLLMRRDNVTAIASSSVRRSVARVAVSQKSLLQDKIKNILGAGASKDIKEIWQRSVPQTASVASTSGVRRSKTIRAVKPEVIYLIDVDSKEEAESLMDGFAEDENYYAEPNYLFKATWSDSTPPSDDSQDEIPVQEQPDEERDRLDELFDFIRDLLLSQPDPEEELPVEEPEPAPPVPTEPENPPIIEEPDTPPVPEKEPEEEVKPEPQPEPTPVPETPAPEVPTPDPIDSVEPLVGNDSAIADQWAVEKINLPEAWALQNESDQEVIVAVIDTGFDIDHSDLRDNVWVNQNEIPDNGVDDDRNGFIDDVHGWDFAGEDGDVFNYSHVDSGSYFHGTHVAGIVAARSNNNVGVASFSYYNKIKVMPLKVFADGEDTAPTSAILSAIDYAVQQGARVINFSLGGLGYSYLYDLKVSAAVRSGLVLVASAGNEGNSLVNYPAGFIDTVSVASSNENEQRSASSSYGQTVDVSAPGEDVLSLFPDESLAYATGTSMAAPMVSGLAATLISQNDSIEPIDVRSVIIESVDPMKTNSFRPVGSGRINAQKAMERGARLMSGDLDIPNEEQFDVQNDLPVLRLYVKKQAGQSWYKVFDESPRNERMITADIVADRYEINIYRAGRGSVPLWTQSHDGNIQRSRMDLIDIVDVLSSIAYAGKFRLEVVAYRGERRMALNQIIWYNVGLYHNRSVEEETIVGESFSQEDVEIVENNVLETPAEVQKNALPQVQRRRQRSRSIVVG